MDKSSKHLRRAASVLTAGGLLWVVKFVVIAATDGAVSGAPETTAGVLYLTAVALMALGSGWLAVALLPGRHVVLRVAGALGGVVAWWATYLAVEALAQAAIGKTDPGWLREEIGIVATGALILTVGLLVVRRTQDLLHVDVAPSAPVAG